MDHSPIDPAGLYENDSLMSGTFTDKKFNNFRARLRRRGFKLSTCKEAYYHPAHWESGVMSFEDGDPGDTWIFSDCFRCKTPEARAFLKKMEEGTQ